MQVLLLTIVLAGIATMLLRASLSRTLGARRTQRSVSGQMLIESCMAEINDIWSSKKPEIFQKDLAEGRLYCKSRNTAGACQDNPKVTTHTCTVRDPYPSSSQYQVQASFDGSKITYTVISGSDKL